MTEPSDRGDLAPLRWDALGREIRRARQDRGWDQGDLSERTGLSVNSVSRIENGATSQLGSLLQIAKALDWDSLMAVIILRDGVTAEEALARRGSMDESSSEVRRRPPRFRTPWETIRLDELVTVAVPEDRSRFNRGRVLLSVASDQDWFERDDMIMIGHVLSATAQSLVEQIVAQKVRDYEAMLAYRTEAERWLLEREKFGEEVE